MSNNSKKVRVENFKIGRDTSSEINSAVIIFIFGMLSLMLPLLQYSSLFEGEIGIQTSDVLIFRDFDQIALAIILVVGSTYDLYFVSAVIGWGTGGFIAAILYGKEGKNGPLYVSYLLLRIVIFILPIYVAIFIINLTLPSGFLLFDSPGTFIYLIIAIIVLLFSLPMVLVAGITYRIGLWLSPST